MKAAAPTDVRPAFGPLAGTVRVPGDKSICHRMALLASVARGRSVLGGFSRARDCEATVSVIRALGVRVEREGDALVIEGAGWRGLRPGTEALDCGRSGTTLRLACGVLSGSPLDVTLTGDSQVRLRPVERVAIPLRRMGADIETTRGRPPLRLRGGSLTAIDYSLPVPSAQVKSAVLLAGLRADGTTAVIEPMPSRDHTERLLAWLGLPIEVEEGPVREISIRRADVPAFEATAPGDVSAAAPLLSAAAIVPGSAVTVEDVGLNPTRTAFLNVLARMGAQVDIEPAGNSGAEPAGAVTVRHERLRAVEIRPRDVPMLIDELPLIGVLGANAKGVTVVRGASELRVKESDRIAGLVSGLRAFGADAEELPDGFAVAGPSPLHGGAVDARGDHRLAMAFALAALGATGPATIDGFDSVADSFPTFVETLEALR
jgi:3-phosphoshikimate 1-carboxyvinyltransferase